MVGESVEGSGQACQSEKLELTTKPFDNVCRQGSVGYQNMKLNHRNESYNVGKSKHHLKSLSAKLVSTNIKSCPNGD